MCYFEGGCPFRALAAADPRAYGIYRWVFASGSLYRRDDKKKLFPGSDTTVEVTRYYVNLKMHRHALQMHRIPRKLWLEVMHWVSLVAAAVNHDADESEIELGHGEPEEYKAIRQQQRLRGW